MAHEDRAFLCMWPRLKNVHPSIIKGDDAIEVWTDYWYSDPAVRFSPPEKGLRTRARRHYEVAADVLADPLLEPLTKGFLARFKRAVDFLVKGLQDPGGNVDPPVDDFVGLIMEVSERFAMTLWEIDYIGEEVLGDWGYAFLDSVEDDSSFFQRYNKSESLDYADFIPDLARQVTEAYKEDLRREKDANPRAAIHEKWWGWKDTDGLMGNSMSYQQIVDRHFKETGEIVTRDAVIKGIKRCRYANFEQMW